MNGLDNASEAVEACVQLFIDRVIVRKRRLEADYVDLLKQEPGHTHTHT